MSPSIHDQVNGDEYYIGVDVGTGSARACIINSAGDIVAVASKDIRTWQPGPGLYVSWFNDPPLHVGAAYII
jgi:ribulose kinase